MNETSGRVIWWDITNSLKIAGTCGYEQSKISKNTFFDSAIERP